MRIISLFFLISLIMHSEAIAYKNWSYKSEKDEFTDVEYSYTYSYPENYRYNDYFTIGFLCKTGQVRFEIDSDTLITSKGQSFKLSYRVDKKDPTEVIMTTYSNSYEGGYNFEQAKRIAKDIFGGSQIYVRAITYDNDYLEAKISLQQSDNNIKKVFKDCGVNFGNGNHEKITKNESYTFADFENDFKKLSIDKQEKLLKKFKSDLDNIE